MKGFSCGSVCCSDDGEKKKTYWNVKFCFITKNIGCWMFRAPGCFFFPCEEERVFEMGRTHIAAAPHCSCRVLETLGQFLWAERICGVSPYEHSSYVQLRSPTASSHHDGRSLLKDTGIYFALKGTAELWRHFSRWTVVDFDCVARKWLATEVKGDWCEHQRPSKDNKAQDTS